MPNVERRLQQSIRVFDRIGLRPYSLGELKKKFHHLQKAIQIGIDRPADVPPTTEDGGLLAIKTGVSPLTKEEWDSVPANTSAIGCAFAGTNWITKTVVKSHENNVGIYTSTDKKEIPLAKRKVKFQQLIDMMADKIVEEGKGYMRISGATELPNRVGIAFGFPHINLVAENGDIDAQLISGVLTKGWEIIDWKTIDHKNLFIGKELKKALETRNIKIKRIVIQNDTNSVGHDYSKRRFKKIPAGAVFGTGDNTSLNDVNLEIGGAVIDLPDLVLDEMKRRKMLPSHKPYKNTIEYQMGGDFIKGRMLAAIGLVGQSLMGQDQIFNQKLAEKIISKLRHCDNRALVSEIASNKINLEQFNHNFNFILDSIDYRIIQETAQRALQQAGQMIGVVLAAVSMQYGLTEGENISFPVEGSVYWFGYQVKATAAQVIEELVSGHIIEPYKADGLTGIAQLSMAR